MGTLFWIRRFFMVLAGAFVVIAGAQFLKGHVWSYCWVQGAFWGSLSAALFIATRLYWSRKGRACALCKDLPPARTSEQRGPA